MPSWAVAGTTCCCAISRVRSIAIPIPTACSAGISRCLSRRSDDGSPEQGSLCHGPHERAVQAIASLCAAVAQASWMAGSVPAMTVEKSMRIGVTSDLRADYLAKGMREEVSAEFDSEITIAAICRALAGLGHEPARIGHVRALTQKLAAGERWDAVFNICEGVAGYAREAQVPALLEAYGIPFVFSDALTLAISLDKAWTKHIVSASGVPTAPFAVIERPADIAAIKLPYPLFLKPLAEGSGKGVNARSRVSDAAGFSVTTTSCLA